MGGSVALPAPKPALPQYRFPMPWGLFAILILYAGAVVFYIDQAYWESPDYQAVVHFVAALKALGTEEGATCSEEKLREGMNHLLESARLAPQEKGFATRVERLRGRFEERKFKLPEDMKHRAEAVSKHAMMQDESRKAWLVYSQRERGWAPDQLLEGPQNVALWSIPGGVLIIVVWAFQQFSHRRAWQLEHIRHVKDQERELEELGAFRQGLGDGAPAPDEEEADDTIADPPPRARPPTANREAVAKRPASSRDLPGVRPPSSRDLPGVRPPSSRDLPGVARKPPTSSGRPAVARRDTGESARRPTSVAPASVAPPKKRGDS